VIRRTFLGLCAALAGLRPRRGPALAVPPGMPRRTGLLIRARIVAPVPATRLRALCGSVNNRTFMGLAAGTVCLSTFAYDHSLGVVQFLHKPAGWGAEYPRRDLEVLRLLFDGVQVEPYTFPTRVPPWMGGRVLHGPLDDPASLADLDRQVRAWAARP
jgi:hypothetical protein